jgi:dienelactone hydrolase
MQVMLRTIALVAVLILSSSAFAAQVPLRTSLQDGMQGKMLIQSRNAVGPREFAIPGSRAEQPAQVWGDLLLPVSGQAPYPTILLSHGSGGLDIYRDSYYDWAHLFTRMGIAVLVLDHFTPRGLKETAHDQLAVSEWSMAADILNAAKLLATHPKIDKTKIATIGFSKGASAILMANMAMMQKAFGLEAPLALHLAFYPSCNTMFKGLPPTAAPVIMFLGEIDDCTPASECQLAASRINEQGGKAETVVFKRAHHGFAVKGSNVVFAKTLENWGGCKRDYDYSTGNMTVRDTGAVFRVNSDEDKAYLKKCVTRGAHVGGNPKVRDQAIVKVRDVVLDRLLGKRVSGQ